MKNTDDLRRELMEAPNLERFLSDNEENFVGDDVNELLNRLFRERGVTKAELAKLSGMSEVYLHQVFSGRRRASRARLICLCCGLRADLASTQELLRKSGYAELYAKDRHDAIILYGLANNMDIFTINDKLYKENEETLF